MNAEQFSDFPEDILWDAPAADSTSQTLPGEAFTDALEGKPSADFASELLDLSPVQYAPPDEAAFVDLPDEAMFAAAPDSYPSALPTPGAEVMTSLPANLFADAEDDREQHIIFNLDGASYAIPLRQTLETSRLPRITPLPFVPEWLLGVANVRGDIISIVDLRLFLGLPPNIQTRSSRMIVVRSTSDDLVTGLLVDGVRSIRRLNLSDVSTSPEEMGAAPYYRGAVEHIDEVLLLLDIKQVLSAPEMRQFGLVMS